MTEMQPSSSNLKRFFRGIPGVQTTARKLKQLPVFAAARRMAFAGSAFFWEKRYREGGTSGSGSYGRLAEFKADVLNEFVRRNCVCSVFELGCGDGAQLELAQYPKYVGVDVSTNAVDRCMVRFAQDPSKHFYLVRDLPKSVGTFDLALSLDVIFHLVEDTVFEAYMRALFERSDRYVIIYSSDYESRTEAPHVRHRKFTDWIAKNDPEWQPSGVIPNRYPFDPARPDETSFADFHFFSR